MFGVVLRKFISLFKKEPKPVLTPREIVKSLYRGALIRGHLTDSALARPSLKDVEPDIVGMVNAYRDFDWGRVLEIYYISRHALSKTITVMEDEFASIEVLEEGTNRPS